MRESDEQGALHIFALLACVAVIGMVILFVNHWKKIETMEKNIAQIQHDIEQLNGRVRLLEGKPF